MNKIMTSTICLSFALLSGTAHANSNSAPFTTSNSCHNACKAAPVKTTRRIVRVEPVKTKKLATNSANFGKHLAKLNTGGQAYGKVLVPITTTSRVRNVYRP